MARLAFNPGWVGTKSTWLQTDPRPDGASGICLLGICLACHGFLGWAAWIILSAHVVPGWSYR